MALPVAARVLWTVRRRDVAVRLIEALARPGEVVADIGASWGLFTHALSRKVGRAGHVHAFEPNPSSLARLRATSHWRRNITIHPYGLADKAATADLFVPYAGDRRVDALGSLSRSESTARSDVLRVSLRDLDSVLPPDRTRLSLIKCDVEGHEDGVLEGARGQLERWHPALLMEIEQRHRTRPIDLTFSLLEQLGYQGYFLDASGPCTLEQFDLNQHQLRFVPEGFVAGAMPDGYVSDFLFVSGDLEVSRLLR